MTAQSPSLRHGRGLARMRAMLWTTSMLAAGFAATSAHAESTLPEGGSVAAGAASIAGSAGSLTVTQSSDHAVINWNSFSVGQGSAVRFVQPDAQSATLNRVTGSAASTIAGTITANGAVYLVNPNGIAITSTGTVQTGGGFVASALDMADADFMAGRNTFTGKDAPGSVGNAGSIVAAQGAYVALLGGSVANSGVISVPLGKIALGAGEQIALDINGNNFLQVAVSSDKLFGSSLVDNNGDIAAPGGRIELRAAALKQAVRNVINMSGSITADSASGDGGTVILMAGADAQHLAGGVTVSGSISARATGASGNGGFVETSGEVLDLNEAWISTTAANGKAGTWLIDPTDFTIAASGGDITGAQLSANLAGGNVTILSSGGAAGTLGNINVNDAVSWSANRLTLDAYNDILVGATMRASGTAGFAGITGDTAGNQVSTGGSLLMGLTNAGFTGRLDLASTASFALNGQGYTIISSLGAQGSVTGTDLQGIQGNLGASYVLGANIDAAATSGWESGAGFQPLGVDSFSNRLNASLGFAGNFNGLGHTIANLKINRPGMTDAGLFGVSTNANFANLALIGGSVAGGFRSGMLIGEAGVFMAGLITRFQNIYATGTVSGSDQIGGLIGFTGNASIDNSFTDVAVTSSSSYAGGLAGELLGDTSITRSHALGTATAANGFAGGLVGASQATIDQSYATGAITGGGLAGGLVGYASAGAISNSYATGAVSGDSDIGGLVGTSEISITNSYATGAVFGANGYAGGLVGNLSGSIVQSYATGTVTSGAGSYNTGGLGGYSTGSISNSYATGAVTSGAGSYNTGGLVGGSYGSSTISNSHATGAVTSGTYSNGTGGLVGGSYVNSAISNSWASGAVTSGTYSNNVGGLVGGQEGTVSNSHATGTVSGAYNVGGLVGAQEGSLVDVWASGAVSGVYSVGGLSGRSYTNSAINRAYATGNVTASDRSAGGLVGYSASTIANSYATGSVSGDRNVGGLLGGAEVTVTNSHATGAVTAVYGIVGGLVGENRADLTNVWASGTVSGIDYVGGLVGDGLYGATTDSWATGAVTATGGYVGGLFGKQGAAISNSYATGNVTASSDMVGGLVGRQNGAISNAYATGNVTSSGNLVGGLVGGSYATLSNSWASGAVSGGQYVGGLAGGAYRTVTNVFATGAVSGSYAVGGLFGGQQAPVTNAYATGSVTNSGNATGGLVGSQGNTLTNVWASGKVNGSGSLVGGLAGSTYALAPITNAYWDTFSTGQSAACGAGSCASILPVTSDPAQSGAANYAFNPAAWANFQLDSTGGQAMTWRIYAGKTYPLLKVFMTGATITAGSGAALTYNGLARTPSGFTATIGGSAAPADPAKILGTPVYGSCAGGDGSCTNVGSYTVNVTGGIYSNQLGYDIVIAPAAAPNLIITPAALTLTYTANPASRLFGAANPALSGSASASGLVNGETIASVISGTAAYTTNANATTPVGNYAITGAGLAANANYTLTSVQAASNATALRINPVVLAAITAALTGSTSKVYDGTTAATLTPANYQLAGFVNGDGATVNQTVGSYATANAGSGIVVTATLAPANFVATGSTDFNNYVLPTSASGAIGTITPAPLTITYAASAASSTYGNAVSGLTGTFIATGLMGSDALSGTASWTTLASSTSSVGKYGVTGSGLVASANYTLTSAQAAGNAAALTITPRALTVTYAAAARSSSYGDAISGLTGTVASTGLVNGDALIGTASWTTGAGATSGVGKYGVTGAGVAASANYTLTSAQAAGNAAALTITPRALTVTYTATAASSIYGNAPSGLTGTVTSTGLVNGDALSGAANWNTSAGATSNAGRYAITGSGMTASSNYALAGVQAAGNATALTVNPRPLAIVANALSREFGAANPVLTYTVGESGLVNGDTLNGALATPAVPASLPGLYPITIGTLTGGANYAITYTGADLKVKLLPTQSLAPFLQGAGSIAPPEPSADQIASCSPGEISRNLRRDDEPVTLTGKAGGAQCATGN